MQDEAYGEKRRRTGITASTLALNNSLRARTRARNQGTDPRFTRMITAESFRKRAHAVEEV